MAQHSNCITQVDGKLETYLKLPPAAMDANPYENLADIDEAGYLLMMSRVPASPGNSLDPRVSVETIKIINTIILNTVYLRLTFAF